MQYSRFVAAVMAAAALPAAEFSTYIGDENTWRISKLIVDASGNTYVAGSRTFNLSQDPIHPDNRTEAVVVKLDAAGKRLLLANIGGKGTDIANAVAVDRAGNTYLAGSTTSPNFPTRNALYPDPFPSTAGVFSTPGFVTKFATDGTIVYSTYFPSPPQSMAVDNDGAVYVTGTTYRSDFPTTPGLPQGPASSGAASITSAAFLTKISPSGDRIVYSTRISGRSKPCGAGSTCFTSSRGATGIAVGVDGAGNAYLAGNSDVTDLPTTPGVVTPVGSGAFVAKVNAPGTALAYVTYIGSGGQTVQPYFTPKNFMSALAVDPSGNAYVAGTTWDPNLPLSSRLHADGTEVTDAYVMKLNPSGTAIVWGSYLGGDWFDSSAAATLDAAGNFWVAGSTRSTAFPNVDGWSTGDDFIVRYDPNGGLAYSARYPTGSVGSIAADSLLRVAVPSAVVHAIGASPRPAVRPWTVGQKGGQVAPGEVIEIFGPHIGGPGARVFIDDIAVPILYSADQQINAIVPTQIAGKRTVPIRIDSGPDFVAGVLPASPRILALTNQDGTLNGRDNPARVGSVMSAWVTGSGYPDRLGLLFADGLPVTKTYEGGYQINFIAPPASSMILVSGNYSSLPFSIYVVP